jgi:alanine racemase
MRKTNGLRTWIEVDRRAIAQNYRSCRALLSKKTQLMAVIKSNAYGHSLVDFGREMERLGADFIGVDSIVEGLTLRQNGIKLPILVLGYTLDDRLEDAAVNDIAVTVANFESFKNILQSQLIRPIKIHFKVDTGMHRQGFLEKDLPRVLSLCQNSDKFKIQGLYTHFASAKNPAFPKETKKQIEKFLLWKKAFQNAGFSPICHAAATAGAIIFPESHFDLVRFGIGLYGYYPSPEVRSLAAPRLNFQPALSWKAIIAEVKWIKKGERIGYDLTETLPRDSKLAVVPVGYWHGLPRVLSSIGYVAVLGKRARIIGRISMDMIVVDVTEIPGVKVGSEVIIIGRSGHLAITAEDLAILANTINYEIITRINPLIRRIYK